MQWKQWKSLQHQNQTLKINNCITMYCNNCHIVYMISIKSNWIRKISMQKINWCNKNVLILLIWHWIRKFSMRIGKLYMISVKSKCKNLTWCNKNILIEKFSMQKINWFNKNVLILLIWHWIRKFSMRIRKFSWKIALTI